MKDNHSYFPTLMIILVKMRCPAFIISILLVFFLQTLNAQVILVTSNADSGPGTLREALAAAAANGTTTIDQIHFNIPATTEAGRTITLLRELPYVKSKTIIDASTQPGAEFGRSDAKVAIRADRTVYANQLRYTGAFFIDRAQDVEIYGFYIYNFYDLINSFPKDTNLKNAGIYIQSSTRVTIGAPGKGNVLDVNDNGIYADGDESLTKSENVFIQSNWIGLRPDGSIPAVTTNREGIYLYANNSIIGGDKPDKGNYIAGHQSSAPGVGGTAIQFGGTNTIFRFNKLGLDIDENPAEKVAQVLVLNASMESKLLIADNVANFISFSIVYVTGFSVLRNRGIVQGGSTALAIERCIDGTLGTDREEDMNIFFGTALGVSDSQRIQVRKNSIWCTTLPMRVSNTAVPDIQVLVNTETNYSGTASPGSEIYIYNDNSGCTTCNPKEFYMKVLANVAGEWKVTGDLAGKKLLANATLIDSSSEYTVPVITPVNGRETAIVQPNCDLVDGSIRLLNVKHAMKIEWYDSSDKKIGEGMEIKKLTPGRYYAKLFNGTCFLRSLDVTLTKPRVEVISTDVEVRQPTCGLSNGYIKRLAIYSEVAGTPLLEWRDKSGKTVAQGDPDVIRLPPGEYTLFVTTSGVCATSYGPVVLTNVQNPASIFPAFQFTTTAAFCGSLTGSVKLDITGNLKPTNFRWVNSSGTKVGDKAEITGMPAGDYRLFLTDEDGCEGLYKTYTINTLPTLFIDSSAIKITTDLCLSGKGSISGVQVIGGTGPYQYSWTDATNKVVATTASLPAAKAGKYTLRVSDRAGSPCSAATLQFDIAQDGQAPDPPQLADVNICAPGIATISVSQAKAGIYRVYKDLESRTPLAESTSPILNVTADVTTTFYVSYSNTTCESERVPVKVSIASSELLIPNSISPNGDLINDTWEIKGLDISQALVTIYNRYGQTVFRSKGYQSPFNGERNGRALPTGTYYYVIDLKEGCRMVKGSLFVIR